MEIPPQSIKFDLMFSTSQFWRDFLRRFYHYEYNKNKTQNLNQNQTPITGTYTKKQMLKFEPERRKILVEFLDYLLNDKNSPNPESIEKRTDSIKKKKKNNLNDDLEKENNMEALDHKSFKRRKIIVLSSTKKIKKDNKKNQPYHLTYEEVTTKP